MHREAKKTFVILLSFLFVLAVFFCYTLPVILVFLRLGHIVADFVFHYPWLAILTKRKFSIFLLSGLVLLFTDKLFRKARNGFSAEINSAQDHLVIWNKCILNISLLLWLVSFILAYLLAPVLYFLDIL
jgi:hypothetical protein